MPFKVLAELASGKRNPSIDKKFTESLLEKSTIPFPKIKVIYTSPAKRAVETAKLIASKNHAKIVKIPELREIGFDLVKICGHKKKGRFNLNKLNLSVLRAMAEGKGSESVLEANRRVNKALRDILSRSKQETLVITHDFLMRIIELRIKKNQPDYQSLRTTGRNDYVDGFYTDPSLSNFTRA